MKMIKLTLPGTIRIKKNSRRIFGYGKFKKVLPSKAYELWENEARKYIMTQIELTRSLPPFSGPIHVKMLAYYKGNRPDLSGAMESVGDCLEGLVWESDSQICSWDGSRMIHDLKNPRTEIMVEEFMEGIKEVSHEKTY